ncbi:diacylglycerol/lipid kinase family protein [Rhizobium alvei]|uniref:Diacylglycerol kinase family lipid kinase n=1 Tax=Rhizobium alvei TaxID=1132659 RepID=A0ABT8YST2_9HYPH|nr:diacylglycerol kinase family protein [Rhizobium alvei]MDO6966776.1 diacylglycerol kinase family lipid kinase [Rhizobium alvei]
MKFRAILNRDGGTFRTTDMQAYSDHAQRIFADNGHQLEIVLAKGEEIADALEAAALRDDLDGILAGGGDGTISAAASIAWKQKMPLGVIPAGTMNLFARSLGVPLDIWTALDALAKGRFIDADIGSADGRAFVHQFSAGMHARMVRLRNQMVYSSRIGKIAANVRASVGVVLNPPEFDVEFDVDGHREHRLISAISVSNNPFAENGLMYSEDLTTGHLGFYVTDPLRPATAARLAVDILRGRMKTNASITEMTGRAVDLHFPNHRHGANCVLDGELLPLGRDVSLRLHPGELKVLVPAAGYAPPPMGEVLLERARQAAASFSAAARPE